MNKAILLVILNTRYNGGFTDHFIQIIPKPVGIIFEIMLRACQTMCLRLITGCIIFATNNNPI